MTVLTTIPGPGVHAGAVTDHPSGEVPERAKRRTFTAAYKLKIVEEYEAATPGERGVVLRREGLNSSHLTEWRTPVSRAFPLVVPLDRIGRWPATGRRQPGQGLRARNTQLEADLDTARRVIEVQGKVSALLEDLSRRAHGTSEASTRSRSGPSSSPRSSR